MKYYFAMGLTLLSLVSQAKSVGDSANALMVSLSNIGTEACILADSHLMVGALKKSTIPKTLPATGEQSVFYVVGPYERSHEVVNAVMSLTYHCGTYKKFTVYMKQYYKSMHYHGNIDVEMRDTQDVFESHQTIQPVRAAYKKQVKEQAGRVNFVVSN